MGRKIGSVISPPPRFHRFIKLWEYCPPSLPRKKSKQRYKQKKKQAEKQTKQRTKTENTHTLTPRNLPKHCDVCRIIFYHVVTLLLARGYQKRDSKVLQRDFVFSLIVRHAWLQLSHVISCLFWHGGMSCDIFASCFTSICLYTKKVFIFKTTSFFGISTLKRLSYNWPSETFQSIALLYKKDTRSNWCFNLKMLLFRKFGSYFHSFSDCRNYSPFLRNETQSFFCLFFVLFQVKSRGLFTRSRP